MSASVDDAVETFARMSAALTGFTPETIRPPLDPVNLSASYYEFVNSRATESLALLLAAFRDNEHLPPQQIAELLLETKASGPGSPSAQLAQSIVRMWYLGSWYTPGPAATLVQVISRQGYIGGLVWKAAQTHPMGYSEFTFGYWAKLPPPLVEFGVNVPPTAPGAAK
jgi:hypothetical protein